MIRLPGRRRPGAGRVRLLFVTPDLRIGGAERHIATLLPALPRDAFDVMVCCLIGEGPFAADLEDAGVPVVQIAGSSARSVKGLVPLVGLMRAERPDVVMTQGFRADVLGRLAARIAGVPFVVTWRHNTGHVGHYGARDVVTESLFRHLTDRYYGVCNGQRPYLTGYLRLPARKLRVIYNGVDPALLSARLPARDVTRANLGVPETAPVVTIVAALREEKDHASFLQAFSAVRERLCDAVALVVGDGPTRATLELQVEALGLGSSVRFLGVRSDIPALLAASDVVALTSTTVECFPYAILEAMALSRPTVATAIGGLPELVANGETGWLVPPHDPAATARALLDILTAPDRGGSLGIAARARLEARFTLRHSVESLVDELTREIAARRPFAGRRPLGAAPGRGAA